MKQSQKNAKETTAANNTLTIDTEKDTSDVVLNRSFKELLPTPELFTIKNKRNDRKKSLNYKAQAVTKHPFPSLSPKPTSVFATIGKYAAKESKAATAYKESAAKEPTFNDNQEICIKRT